MVLTEVVVSKVVSLVEVEVVIKSGDVVATVVVV